MMETSHSVFIALGDNTAGDSCTGNEHRICALQNGVALLFAAFNMILNFIVLAIIHERAPRTNPLPDISFDILPNHPNGLYIAEYIITIQAFLVFTSLFLHRSRVILFRRLCLILGVIYFARAVCMSSTQVPLIKTDLICAPVMGPNVSWSEYITEIIRRALSMMLGLGLSINGQHNYCGDYIFSGHTVTLTFCKYFIITLPQNMDAYDTSID